MREKILCNLKVQTRNNAIIRQKGQSPVPSSAPSPVRGKAKSRKCYRSLLDASDTEERWDTYTEIRPLVTLKPWCNFQFKKSWNSFFLEIWEDIWHEKWLVFSGCCWLLLKCGSFSLTVFSKTPNFWLCTFIYSKQSSGDGKRGGWGDSCKSEIST